MKKRPTTMHYILSLILEVGTIAAFSLGAWRIFPGMWRLPSVIIVFALLLSVWSVFLIRHASKKLPMPFLAVCITALAIGAVVTLFLSHFEVLAAALGVVAMIDLSLLIILWWWHPEALARVASPRDTDSRPARRSMTKNVEAAARHAPQQGKSRRYSASPAGTKRPSRRH